MKLKVRIFITFILALLVGLIFSLRDLTILHGLKHNPSLVFVPFGTGDEATYASQIREVFEGKYFSGDAYAYETRTKPPIFPWLDTLILGLMAKLLNSVELIFRLGDFLFPATIFCLSVYFVYRLTKAYWGAVVAGLSMLFLFHLTTKIPPVSLTMIKNLLAMISLKEPFFLTFNRLPPPQFTFIFFLLFIIVLYQTLIKNNHITPFITGLLSGLLAYIYFYHWTASLVILGFCLIFSLVAKHKTVFKRLLTASVTALIISSGYLWQILSSNLVDKQLSEGRVDGRFIEPLTTLRYGLFSLILYYFLPPGPVRQLLISWFLSAVVLMNLQVITGFTMDAGHWPNSTFEPLVVLAGFILLIYLLQKHRFKKVLSRAWLLIIPIFVYAIGNQIAVAQAYQQLRLIPLEEQELFNWLNQNSPSDSVVLSLDKKISRLIPAKTHNYVFLPYGSYSQVSTEELWQRFNLACSIYQLPLPAVSEILSDSQGLAGYLFVQTYRYTKKDDLTGLSFPPEIIKKINQSHPIFDSGYFYIPDNLKQLNLDKITQLTKLPLKDKLCQFKLDYLVFTEEDTPLIKGLLDQGMFKLVFHQGQFSLLELESNFCQML